MKKLNVLIGLGFLILFLGQRLDAQKVSLFTWKDRINQFTALYPQEKVYLHLDNTSYYLGDTLWFKAYVVSTPGLTKTNLSQTLYVDLLSPEGYIIASKNLKIENGGCHGEFILRKPLESGFCEIRAYTRYMLNFGQENLFSRVLPIFDQVLSDGGPNQRTLSNRKYAIPVKRLKEPTTDLKKKKSPAEVVLQFYPEGGNLVRNIENQVAFKVTDADGRNLDISASLYNRNKLISEGIRTLRQGMGAFSFTPKNGAYDLTFRIKSKDYTFQLPKIESSGYVLNVDNIHGEKLDVQIHKSSDEPADSLGLMLTCRGVVCGFIPMFTDKKEFQFSFPWKDLPVGVIQLTLFQKQGQIICQRQAFAGKSLPLSIGYTLERNASDPGEEIRLNISTTNADGNPVPTTISMAVRDLKSESPSVPYPSIYADLLLTSDLKGYIEDPEWYFLKTDNKKLEALDLLMMVQGWTRYPWYQLTGLESFALKQPIDKGILVSGRLFTKNSTPLTGETLVRLELDSAGFLQNKVFTTGSDGFFAFWTSLQGKWKLRLVDENNNRDMSLRLKPSPGASIKPRFYAPSETLAPVLVEPSTAMDNNALTTFNYENMGFKEFILQNASLIYDIGAINDFGISKPDLPENVLKFLFQENNNFRFNNLSGNLGLNQKITYNNLPVIFFDNKTQMTTDIMIQLLETRMQDISKIAIVENRTLSTRFIENKDNLYNIDSRGYPICVFLFYNNDQIVRKRLNDVPTYQTFLLDGYATPRTFKAMPYGTAPDPKSHRRTLYWNPDLKTDASGKAEVRMYLDQKGKEIIMNAEGLVQ